MTHDPIPFLFPDDETDDAPRALSATAHLLDKLARYGHRPGPAGTKPIRARCPKPEPSVPDSPPSLMTSPPS